MIIKRDRYLKQVIAKKQDGMIKIVTSIRRCGKSYLLNVLFLSLSQSPGLKKSGLCHIVKF